jgi:hypothetical protein
MAKLKVGKMEKMEGATDEKRKSSRVMGGASINEAPGEINTKAFGHIKKATKALHASDPYIASHKL